jgi:hypothetical protein
MASGRNTSPAGGLAEIEKLLLISVTLAPGRPTLRSQPRAITRPSPSNLFPDEVSLQLVCGHRCLRLSLGEESDTEGLYTAQREEIVGGWVHPKQNSPLSRAASAGRRGLAYFRGV